MSLWFGMNCMKLLVVDHLGLGKWQSQLNSNSRACFEIFVRTQTKPAWHLRDLYNENGCPQHCGWGGPRGCPLLLWWVWTQPGPKAETDWQVLWYWHVLSWASLTCAHCPSLPPFPYLLLISANKQTFPTLQGWTLPSSRLISPVVPSRLLQKDLFGQLFENFQHFVFVL